MNSPCSPEWISLSRVKIGFWFLPTRVVARVAAGVWISAVTEVTEPVPAGKAALGDVEPALSGMN